MHENSLKNLIAGKNKKPGGDRTNIVLSGPARALARLLGGGIMADGVEIAMRKAATLADKALLIHRGVWELPEFDEFGLITSYGWENEFTYTPSPWVLDPGEGIEQFRCIESSDSMDLKWALDQYGIDACLEEFQFYSFDGAFQGVSQCG